MSLMFEMPVAALARKVGEHDTAFGEFFNTMFPKQLNTLMYRI